jgi:hypothetical protein
MKSGEHPRGFCRRCGFTAFADDDNPKFQVTQDMRDQWHAERVKAEEARKRSAEQALARLRREKSWLRYAEQLDETGLAMWRARGVPDEIARVLFLGYCPDREFWVKSGQDWVEYHTSTLAIPVFAPGWEPVNIRHRLVVPYADNDKYRPEFKGLPDSLYLTNPDEEPTGECVVVEGEVKSIVTYSFLDGQMQVNGLSGKSKFGQLSQLSKCDRIYVVPDPDAVEQGIRMVKELGTKRARLVRLPVKPDDFFVLYGGTKRDFLTAIKQSRSEI